MPESTFTTRVLEARVCDCKYALVKGALQRLLLLTPLPVLKRGLAEEQSDQALVPKFYKYEF